MAGCVAVDDQHAEWRRAIEGFHEHILADSIEYGADATGHDALGGGNKIHLTIKNGVIAAMIQDDSLLRGIADRADDGRTEMFRPLNQQETNAAGGSVDQDRVSDF